ncbi:cytidine deaminase [soil metagenome]
MTDQLLKMLNMASEAMHNAYCPYSSFAVGVCILVQNKLFSGCNVENSVYGLTQCAEANAIGNMVTVMGTQKISEILVISNGNKLCPPCGACRQLLQEFSADEMLIHLAIKNEVVKTLKLSQLFPVPFRLANEGLTHK